MKKTEKIADKVVDIEAKMAEKQKDFVPFRRPFGQSNPIYSKFIGFLRTKEKFSLKDIFK